MAYAAVLSLDQILEDLSNPRHLEQHQTPLQDQQIKSLQKNLKFLIGFLDDSEQRRSEELRCLEREIRDATYKIEDIMESHISKNFGQESSHERQIRDQIFCQNFAIVADEINSIKTKAAKLKELWGETDLHQSQRTSLPTGQSRLPSIGKNDMVGFGKDLTEIMERLIGYPDALQTIPITGMGGIGKTTLARNVYDHPRIVLRFDTRAWVSISQEYREREVLLSLLDSTKQLNAEMHQEKSTEDLKECLYKSLKGRRYLVVMDDVWTTAAWDSLRKIFPDDTNGSRIMLTTRLLSVVDSDSSPRHMQFLNKTDSWNLLRREVFREDCCPLELEEAGKKIAENCKGLPLSLVVIGGYLSKVNRTKHLWEDVAENVKAVVNAEDPNCSGILSLSYDYLPHYLKPCFLYMGVFPEDYKIRVSKLIKLWVAEGFLKPVRDKTLEKVAEEYLGDLISRNLIMISKKSSRGKIKTCGIHDMLRDLCLKKAQEENFFHVRDKDDIKYSRRLCIHPDILHEEFKGYQSMGSLPAVRSILIQEGFRKHIMKAHKGLDESQINELVDGKLFPLLRVLDLNQRVDGFPFVKFVHSRYLAFPCSGKITIPKTLPDFLGYLQTLIVHSDDVHLPEEIWRMTQLRHLLFWKCYLPCPTRSPIAGENFVLGNLLTLSKVSSSSCTKKVFERVPNLNKLGILRCYLDDEISLGTLVYLPQLETLKIVSMVGPVRVPINFTFPPYIKKLTFSGSKISWKHMTTVGSMPNLVVLKLLDNAFVGQEWEPTEGEFCKLKYLLLSDLNLVQWRVDGTHFPCLESLIIRQCFELEELPCSIGDSTLQIIELDDASPSAVTWAKKIQEAQDDLGNDSLQVHVNYRFQPNRLRMKELAERIGSNDDTLLLQATEKFRESFSRVHSRDPMREVVSEVVPRLLELLNKDGYPQLQREAALAISTISSHSSDCINILIDHGAIPLLLSLLRFPDDNLCEQSQRTSLPTGPSTLALSRNNAMVGFDNDLNEIMDRLTGYPPALQIIQVTGMGGIGKTTLARNVYNNPLIEEHFQIRAWASISQEYRKQEVLLSLLDSTKRLNAEKSTGDSREDLYKSLKGRRYLVVMDDVWTTEAWDSLRMIFPDDGNGSRIMLTTRLSSMVDSHSYLHHMQFLNKTDSWNLLRREVFGEDCCPLELEEAGKEIAENCKGLPLSLVVIGGHLSKANKTKHHWEDVAENVKAVVIAEDANCSRILSLSYDYLPHYLKACFLYMGVFPEDDEIRVSKLIKLWVAEGFLKPVRGKTLEEVAEEYLGDLISRNLIMISEKSSSGKIKTCSIHDMLRDLCIRKADKDVNIFAEGIKYSRRLCIDHDFFHRELSISDTSNVNPSMGSLPTFRSILCSGWVSEIYKSGELKLFPLIRVLDLAKGNVDGFPIGGMKLVHARYLAFSSYGKISIPKILPDFLWYLQTLIVDCMEVLLPEEIWRMPQLRHLLFGKCYLPCSARSPIDGENLVLGNLLTLSKVSSSSCSKEVFKRVPNLKKLGIWIEELQMTAFSPDNLINLPQLETLKIKRFPSNIMNFTFPPNIKKLTLADCKIAWKHMTIVGSMPNLEVLKLLDNAFDGPEWEPTEGEFCKLKYLLLSDMNLVQWSADDTHFPRLERLIIRECFELEEIPCSIGNIPTLQIIELDDASPSAVTSAEQIQEEQEYLGNDSLQVHVDYLYQPDRRRMKELAERIGSNDDTLLLQAMEQFRESFEDVYSRDPMREVVSGVVPRLLEFLNRDGYPQLQKEAALAISRVITISSHPLGRTNDRINILIEHGAIPILLSLLRSPDDDRCLMALRLLGDFAFHSTKSRDLIISYGGLMPLLAQFNDTTKLTIMRAATHTLSNLCRREPQFEQVKPALLLLSRLIHTDDVEVLRHACWAIIYLASGTEDGRLAVVDAGVFPRLIELLLHPSRSVRNAALCAVASTISNVDDIQIQVIIDLLPCLLNFLTKEGDIGKDSTCQIISEIIRRSKDNLQAVIEAGIISPLLQMFQHARYFNAAAEVIYNATTKGTNEQIKLLVHEGCIEPMCDLLVNPYKVHVIKICLEGLENILKVGEAEKNQGNTDDSNVFAQMIDDACGLQKIKNLQTHDDSRVCEMAVRILETYWPEEGDE